jgi:hypothetical protein
MFGPKILQMLCRPRGRSHAAHEPVESAAGLEWQRQYAPASRGVRWNLRRSDRREAKSLIFLFQFGFILSADGTNEHRGLP